MQTNTDRKDRPEHPTKSFFSPLQAVQDFVSGIVEEMSPALREVRQELQNGSDEAMVSPELQQRLSEFERVVEEALSRLDDKTTLLEGAKRDHELFERLRAKVRDWIAEANACLRRHTAGVDARVVTDSRRELARLFPATAATPNYESSYAQDLREMKKVAESIYSALDANDAATFKESTQRIEQQVRQLHAEEALLTERMSEVERRWAAFRERVEALSELLTSGEARWSSLALPVAEDAAQAAEQVRQVEVSRCLC